MSQTRAIDEPPAVDEWPEVMPKWASQMGVLDTQNGATLGRILGRGQIGHAQEGPDGKMHATVRIPPDELIWEPGILVMPHEGELELELVNDDLNTHCAVLPSNGDSQFIWLVNHSRGTATLHLDGPGYYWYGSRTGNDEGRGLTGAIVVQGEVPEEARLDRPPQPRP
jgi:PQQ system protein